MRSSNRSEEEYRVAGDGSNGSDRGETLDRSRGEWPSATEVAAMTVNIISHRARFCGLRIIVKQNSEIDRL